MQVDSSATQPLSAFLPLVRAGEEVLIVEHDVPIARIVPVSAELHFNDFQRAEALTRLLQRLGQGYDLGGLHVDRDELYDRS